MWALIVARLRQRSGIAIVLGITVIVAVWESIYGEFAEPVIRWGFELEAWLMCAAGALMGFHAFAYGRRTHAYLIHRSTGHDRAFWATMIADCGALLATQVLFFAGHALWIASTPDRAIAFWDQYIIFGMAALSVCVGHALGSVAGLLRQRMVFAVCSLGLMAGGGSLIADFALARVIRLPLPPWFLWLACVALATAALAFVALAMFKDGVVDDRAHRGPVRIAAAVVGVVLVAPLFVTGASSVQGDCIDELIADQPSIVAKDSGEIELAAGGYPGQPSINGVRTLYSPRYWDWSLVPVSHFSRGNEMRSPPRLWREIWRPFPETSHTGPIYRAQSRDYDVDLSWGVRERSVLCIVRPLESMHKLAFDHPDRKNVKVEASPVPPAPFRVFLGPKNGETFSPSAYPEYFSRSVGDRSILETLIVEPLDRTIWAWNRSIADPRLERVSFGTASTYDRLGFVESKRETASGLDLYREPAVVCGSQFFVRQDGHFVPWAREGGPELETTRIDGEKYRVETIDSDALEPRVAIHSTADGRVLFEHAFTVEHGPYFVLAQIAALCQAPLSNLNDFLGGQPIRWQISHNDRLLDGHRRPWLLALNFAVAAMLATFTWRRLSHPRARAARWTWTIATLLLGIPAVMARLVVEPVFNTEIRVAKRREPATLVLRTE